MRPREIEVAALNVQAGQPDFNLIAHIDSLVATCSNVDSSNIPCRHLSSSFQVQTTWRLALQPTTIIFGVEATHAGTHVDAPYHYTPISEGRPAKTIDQIPLNWCFAPGVPLDFRHKAPGEFITV